MTARRPHVHVLDTGEGDWGAYPDRPSARRAAVQALKDFNGFSDIPMTPEEFTIVSSDEWCADGEEPCYYDRNAALLAAMRQPPLWSHDFPGEPRAVYRIDGKRVPRWKMACSMTMEQAVKLWPVTGHPVAIPLWHYDSILFDPALCPCSNRNHRRKNCIIGPHGLKCSVCGALHQDYGNISHYCLGCQDWMDRREAYLADWASENNGKANTSTQVPLL